MNSQRLLIVLSFASCLFSTGCPSQSEVPDRGGPTIVYFWEGGSTACFAGTRISCRFNGVEVGFLDPVNDPGKFVHYKGDGIGRVTACDERNDCWPERQATGNYTDNYSYRISCNGSEKIAISLEKPSRERLFKAPLPTE